MWDQNGGELKAASKGIHHYSVTIDTLLSNLHHVSVEVLKKHDGVGLGTGQGEDICFHGGKVNLHALGKFRRGTYKWKKMRQLVSFFKGPHRHAHDTIVHEYFC